MIIICKIIAQWGNQLTVQRSSERSMEQSLKRLSIRIAAYRNWMKLSIIWFEFAISRNDQMTNKCAIMAICLASQASPDQAGQTRRACIWPSPRAPITSTELLLLLLLELELAGATFHLICRFLQPVVTDQESRSSWHHKQIRSIKRGSERERKNPQWVANYARTALRIVADLKLPTDQSTPFPFSLLLLLAAFALFLTELETFLTPFSVHTSQLN